MSSTIVFPEDGDTIHEMFVASGYLRRGQKHIWGELVGKNCPPSLPSQIRYPDSMRWVMFFKDIDISNGPYTLKVYSECSPNVPIDEAVDLTVANSGGGLEILSPRLRRVVAPDFCAYGTTDQPESAAILCKKIEKDGYSKNAENSVLRDGAFWAVSFIGVNTGNDYELIVSHNSDCNGGDSVDRISVRG